VCNTHPEKLEKNPTSIVKKKNPGEVTHPPRKEEKPKKRHNRYRPKRPQKKKRPVKTKNPKEVNPRTFGRA